MVNRGQNFLCICFELQFGLTCQEGLCPSYYIEIFTSMKLFTIDSVTLTHA
jgi:hypothetical protein